MKIGFVRQPLYILHFWGVRTVPAAQVRHLTKQKHESFLTHVERERSQVHHRLNTQVAKAAMSSSCIGSRTEGDQRIEREPREANNGRVHHLKGKLAAQETNDPVVGNRLFGCDPAAKVFYHDLHFWTHTTRGGHDQGGGVSIFTVTDALLVLVLRSV